MSRRIRSGYDLGMSEDVGRVLFVVGLVVAGIGLLAMLGIRLPLGRLPGDVFIGGERGGIFIPIVSSIVISIILTIILNLVFRR